MSMHARPLTDYGGIKCAASNTRMTPPWDGYRVEPCRAYEGDVVLVEALSDRGAYAQVENATGRSEALYRGDRFLAVLGNRESSKYLCGSVPRDGIDVGPDVVLHLLSNGGIVGVCDKSPDYMGTPLPLGCHGVLKKDGCTVNTIRLSANGLTGRTCPLVLVAASATDAGKTTLAARLVASLSRDHDLRVAATKLAGTGCLEDILLCQDAGARWVADFPDVGLPSTYTDPGTYRLAVRMLLHRLANLEPDIVVAELGGDLIWANIPTLLRMPDVMESVLEMVVITSDVLGAIGAQQLLREWQVTVPVLWATPPTRNHLSFKLRMDAYVSGELIDTRNPRDIEALAARIARQLKPAERTEGTAGQPLADSTGRTHG